MNTSQVTRSPRRASGARPRSAERRVATGLTAAVLALGLAACGSDSDADAGSASGDDGAAESTTVVVNYEPTAAFMTLKLAYDEGIFEKHGLDVELHSGGPGSSSMSSLLNGQLHVSPAALASAVLAVDEGLPIVVASNLNNESESDEGPSYATVAAPGSGIESFADLNGKTVAVHSTTCCWVEFTSAVIDAEGGDSSTVNFLPVPFPNQMQAMRDGEVDAMTSVQPFITIATGGDGTILGPTASLAVDGMQPPGGVAVMARDFAEENPQVVEAWQAAIAEASEYAHASPEEMRALIAQETGIDAELVDQLPLPDYSATFDQAAFDATIQFMAEYGAISLDDLPTAEDFLLPGVTG